MGVERLRNDFESRLGATETAVADSAGIPDRLATLEAANQHGHGTMERIGRDLARLKAILEALFAQGSAATTKCISCFDKRYQEENKFALGSDGKVYQHRRPSVVSGDTSSVNLK